MKAAVQMLMTMIAVRSYCMAFRLCLLVALGTTGGFRVGRLALVRYYCHWQDHHFFFLDVRNIYGNH